MDDLSKSALKQLEEAEAELAVLRQEGVLRHLLDAGEPTADAVSRLTKLREVVARLKLQGAPSPKSRGALP